MRLDPSYLHFISKQEMRILLAIEIGMKNHEYVPIELISSIGNLRSGETFKTIRKLLKVKLIVHVGKKNNGYKLTYLGYDYLALHTFIKRGLVKDVICKIGVGKESDIYKCEAPDGTHIVLKLTRLGRRSFKTIKNNREYIQNRTSFNWLYLSRLSSIREFTFMQVLHEDGFPTPRPIDTNRHAILMSLIDGDPLCHVKKIGEHCSIRQLFEKSLQLVEKFASRGLIHGDFNEFNLLINNEGTMTVIDFPQCVSSNHTNAQDYFDRDIECLYTFFDKMLKKSSREQEDGNVYIHENDVGFDVASIPMPELRNIEAVKRLDLEVRAKGHFKLSEEKHLEDFMVEWNKTRGAETEHKEAEESEDEVEEGQFEEITEKQQQQIQKQLESSPRKDFKAELDENDEDLKELINQLEDTEVIPHARPEGEAEAVGQSSEGEDSQGEGEMRQEWKGLTAYQIRQILKQQRRKVREEKKKQMSAEQYIKKALYRKGSGRAHLSKGNYGAKQKVKQSSLSIKEGMELGW